MENKSIQTTKEKGLELNPAAFMQQAIDKGLTPEVLTQFMDLYDRWENKQAKKQFDAAMAKFQGECPIIEKGKLVKNKDGSDRYRYAPLDQIVKQVGPKIAKNGLSYTVNASQEGDKIKATIVVTHTGGYSQASSFEVPSVMDQFTSKPQQFGIALTYAKRYAFCNAFGILTQDPDTDAQKGMPTRPASSQVYDMALKQIVDANDTGMLMDFKKSIESGRGSKLYVKEQKDQLLRMIDAKIKELNGKS